jgi:Ca2+-binding RTX toxin-like protein
LTKRSLEGEFCELRLDRSSRGLRHLRCLRYNGRKTLQVKVEKMRKATTMVALVGLLTLMAAGAAYAATIVGNANDNYLKETCGTDTMYARAGDDVLDADECGRDFEVMYGDNGRDLLLAADGDTRDILSAGKGFDTCVVDSRAESVFGSCNRVIVL